MSTQLEENKNAEEKEKEETIKGLQEELNELEKRIKKIEYSQGTLEQLMEIAEYFKIVQTYLIDLNTMYENHIIESEQYSAQITSLQEQINSISERVENIAVGGEYNLEEMKNNIELIKQKLEDLTNGSESTLINIDTQIEFLQTNQQNMQDNIDINTSNISTHTQEISNLKTSVNNLTATQNSLTSSQSNLSSNVSNINSRLTTAEANIDALTEGVDVGYLDTRISNLEHIANKKCMVKNKYKMFLNVTSSYTFYSMFYYYKTSDENFVVQNFNLKYNSTASGTLTLTMLQNNVEMQTISIDLSKYSNEYSFNYVHTPTDSYQSFQFKFSSTTTVNFEELDVMLFGENVELFETDQDLKVSCYNGEVYVIKYDDYKLKVSITPIDDFTLNTNTLTTLTSDYYSAYIKRCRCAFFGALLNYNTADQTITKVNNYLVVEAGDENRFRTMKVNNDGTVSDPASRQTDYSGVVTVDTHPYGMDMYIKNGEPVANFGANVGIGETTIKNLKNYMAGKWYFATIARQNNYINNVSPYLDRSKPLILAYYEDGNIYAINKLDGSLITKVGKGGKYVTAYYQTDGSVNVYISKINKTHKYNLTPNDNGIYSSTYMETFTDCDCFYELINGKHIKHTSSGWELVDSTATE